MNSSTPASQTKNFIGYTILFYCSGLLGLLVYLSHFTFDPKPIETRAEGIKQPFITQTNKPSIVIEQDLEQPIVELAPIAKPAPTIKPVNTKPEVEVAALIKGKIHRSFQYITDEPETYQSRAIPNFSSFKVVSDKKKAFINFFQPIIDEQNALQLRRREQLIAIKSISEAKKPLGEVAAEILLTLATAYRISKEFNETQTIQELEQRINMIPGSMVLAQAASESAWGTSRFAKQANNFFGQWCFSKGCGIIPARRPPNSKHEIAKFASAESSVRAYFKNLNTYHTYKDFRSFRKLLIDSNQPLTGIVLTERLKRYSERGEEYIKEVQSIIRFNKFDIAFGEKEPTTDRK